MKIQPFFALFGLAMLIGLPLHAQEAAAPLATNATTVGEVLKDVQIHSKPKDFREAQTLALQNRQERLDLVSRAMACMQKAQGLEDIYNCQEIERREMTLLRLSYCDTALSFVTGRARSNLGQTWPEGTPSECARALWAVTGQPMNWTEEQRAAGAKAVVEDLQKQRQGAQPGAAIPGNTLVEPVAAPATGGTPPSPAPPAAAPPPAR